VLFDTTVGIQAGAGVKGAAFKSEAPAVFKNGEVKIELFDDTQDTFNSLESQKQAQAFPCITRNQVYLQT
jgi:hypothetical protein